MALGILRTATLLLALSVSFSSVWCLKVNVEGTVSLGKEVMDTVGFYLKALKLGIRRRSQGASLDDIDQENYLAIKLSYICQVLPICKDPAVAPTGLENYILKLNHAIEDTILNELKDYIDDVTAKPALYNDTEQENLVKDMRVLLLDTTNRLSETAVESQAWVWIHLLKQIHIRMQAYADQKVLQVMDLKNVKEEKRAWVQNNFIQKLLPKTDSIENSFVYKIYVHNNLLNQSEYYRCTVILSQILLDLKVAPLKTVKDFVKTFYYSLAKTNFYKLIEDKTARGLDIVLSDMAFTDKVSAKEVLTTVLLVVEDRLHTLEGKTAGSPGHTPTDRQLIYAILADLDYMFSEEMLLLKNLQENFHSWSVNGGDLKTIIDQFLSQFTRILNTQPRDLLDKLLLNVKVFLEYTIETDV